MGVLPSYSHVSTTVWMHYLNFNEMPGEKDRRKLHKNAVGSLEQILKAVTHKTAVVWPLTYYLINHPSKMSKTCWAQLEK